MAKIDFFGTNIELNSSNRLMEEDLLRALPPGWSEGSFEVPDQCYDIEVGSKYFTLWIDGRSYNSFGSVDELHSSLESQLSQFVSANSKKYIFVHAGVVAWKDRFLIFPGYSRSGKSTLVRDLVQLGAVYYSDEYAVLDPSGRVLPYARRLSLRGEDHEILFQRHISVDAIGGAYGTDPVRGGLICVTRFRLGARWEPYPIRRGRLLLELLNHTIPARRRPYYVHDTLVKLVPNAVGLAGERGETTLIAPLLLQLAEHTKIVNGRMTLDLPRGLASFDTNRIDLALSNLPI